MREALFYVKEGDRVKCSLCPHECLISEGKAGFCRQRKHINGKLMAEGYARVSSIAMDPIEKKPLYHFYPGSFILSVGGLWCNLRCSFCQNWHIAHREQSTTVVEPEKLVEMAIAHDSVGIAFTYNEPVIWYEYILDTAQLCKQKDLKVVLVTNGFIQIEPLKYLLPYVDAFNIDVKAFNDRFYREICGGDLSAVKKVVEHAAKKAHVEITTLIIGGLNDDKEEINELARWLSEIDRNIPLHLSRYYPNYRMQLPPTPVATLYRLRDMAREYLNFVYVGNVVGADNNTYCPQCRQKIVDRGYVIRVIGLKDNRCINCGTTIPIVI
ncbi:pyruvate formate lyase activating enzyme [Caldicoprobacter guelmensis]|uniref:AmmeMemoRadiSam system radical SAM enzyme n=1 Tax=Caldicoprobacter guelmensis TaxID=1170224 RepID=UPI00195AB7CE|nr:AmmeMemoRadiSam system radical SAM enzyme [Caldicoprobacter guelmensis]MBM7581596.1 pyruvate formate lyase activating enzyme [Caldicoprobacter guelmensis]